MRTVVATDEERLRRARSGDSRALDDVLASVRPAVYRYCLARLGSPDLADDVTQEVSLAVVTALPRYRDEGRPFLAYVFGIASNKVSEARRSSARRREQYVDSLPETWDPTAGPEELAGRLDTIQRVRQLLGRLPRQHQELLLLRVAAGLSAEEVGATLGMSVGAVRVAQHRALAKLRDSVTAETAP